MVKKTRAQGLMATAMRQRVTEAAYRLRLWTELRPFLGRTDLGNVFPTFFGFSKATDVRPVRGTDGFYRYRVWLSRETVIRVERYLQSLCWPWHLSKDTEHALKTAVVALVAIADVMTAGETIPINFDLDGMWSA